MDIKKKIFNRKIDLDKKLSKIFFKKSSSIKILHAVVSAQPLVFTALSEVDAILYCRCRVQLGGASFNARGFRVGLVFRSVPPFENIGSGLPDSCYKIDSAFFSVWHTPSARFNLHCSNQLFCAIRTIELLFFL